jgi:hypothetical protein
VSPRDSVAALQTFEAVLTLAGGQEVTEEVRGTVQAYNRDDCFSALQLRDWLEERRRDAEAINGQVLRRATAKSGEPS